MTTEERVDLKIAIELIRDLSKKIDDIPAQTQRAIEDRLALHLARAHTNDAEVVSDVRVLMGERIVSGAFKTWCGHYWRQLTALAGAVIVVLEILEITNVI